MPQPQKGLLCKGGAYGDGFWLSFCCEFAQARGADCGDYISNADRLGAQAASYTINQDSSIYWDLGQGFVSSDQTVSLDNFELPVVGDDSQAFRIVLDNVQFANVASSVYGQDETGQASLVLSITGSGAGSYLAQYLQQSKEPNVVFVTQNEAGAEVETKQLTANTSDAIFSYTIGAQVLGSGIGLTRELSQIEFVSQTDLGQYLSVSQTQGVFAYCGQCSCRHF